MLTMHAGIKPFLIGCFCVLAVGITHAQDLLANGGFEDENICSEYHIKCAPEAWICTSPSYYFYFKGREVAHSGIFFMGMVAGHTIKEFKRTFIRSRLVCGLQQNHHYRISFYMRSPHPLLDSVGIFFSDYDFLFEKRIYNKIMPTMFVADAMQKPVKGDTSWQQVVMDYTATGQENFFTIGYFAKKDLRGTNTGVPMENNFLFFVDDFSMQPVDPAEQLCPDWRLNTDTIYAQNERHEWLDREIKYYRNNLPWITPFATTIVPHIDTLLIPDILFASGSAVLNKGSHPLLDSFCAAINKKNLDSICVEGHTDSVGTLEHNMQLSMGRARAVVTYIQQQLAIREEQFRVRWFAYNRPVASNKTAEGRQKNRRVEILLYRHN